METAEGRRERRDARRNLERVLEAARELFAERGADVTMEEVARRAGVGVGTIYRRFPSKEHLYTAVSHAACSDARHSLQAAAQNVPEPLARLRALVIVQYRRNAHLAELIEPRPTSDAATCHAEEPQELYQALHTMLAQVIADGQRRGEIRQGNPQVLAALCLELLSPRAFHNLARVVGGGPEDVAEQMVGFVLHGLKA
jgi:AcrR family transcriptional regulator